MTDRRTAPTIRVDIFIGGDLADARRICRDYCYAHGLCVTVEPVDFIYTGASEAGVRVGLINYPRFPSSLDELRTKAEALAERLLEGLYQHSYSLVAPDETVFRSRRAA